MYCVKCGVKLADSERCCPLCGTVVYHPDIERESADRPYPEKKYPGTGSSKVPAILLTVLAVLSSLTVFLCDMQVNRSVTWSGYVMGALVVAYVMAALPAWFRRPNPVVFVPCAFLTIGGYVLYIDIVTHGGWFLSFAFPVVGIVGITVTVMVVLFRYLRSGRLFVVGGALTALGICMLPIEFLAGYTFGVGRFIGWSLYPLIALVLIGGFLIFLGIYRPARETMERIFFI